MTLKVTVEVPDREAAQLIEKLAQLLSRKPSTSAGKSYSRDLSLDSRNNNLPSKE